MMSIRDKKRLLLAFLAKRRKLLKLARKYKVYFRDEVEDLVQMVWEILARRPSWGPHENVIWRAQDALRNLVKDRKESQAYIRERLFSGKTTSPIDDYAGNEWRDEAGEQLDDENLHASHFPDPERALLEKERVLAYRGFLADLKGSLNPVERAIVEAAEKDADDTTDLQRQLGCDRDDIYKARFTLKQKALKLRDRWRAAGRELPGFDELLVIKRPPADVVNIADRKKES